MKYPSELASERGWRGYDPRMGGHPEDQAQAWMDFMDSEADTILLRKHLAPLCGWNLIPHSEEEISAWRKEGHQDVDPQFVPIPNTIEGAISCLPEGIIMIRMEWDMDYHNREHARRVIFCVQYKDGSTQPFVLGWSGKPNEKQARFHLAIMVHDELAKKKTI
jgi:hypothetical protein